MSWIGRGGTVGLGERYLRSVTYVARLLVGFCVYAVSRKTPRFAYQSMVALFCMTRGRSNDWLSRLIGAVRRPVEFKESDGILGKMSEDAVRRPVLEQLRERGYYVFERCVPDDLCDKLLQFAVSTRCTMRRMDGAKTGDVTVPAYHRRTPQAVRYDFELQDLLRNDDIQSLIADLSFAALAQDYLGSRPVLDVLTMWWHTSFSDKPDSEAAQFFHFDMDRPKWLKFFIYLTDVEPANGPHSFVAGSHRTDGIPEHMLRKGYARLSDEEVERAFERTNIMHFTAPRGTIIAEDTRGLHKGQHVESGDRLVLQFQFSNSLFGGAYPSARMDTGLSPILRERSSRFPFLFAAYL